jgi:hypothetical protein
MLTGRSFIMDPAKAQAPVPEICNAIMQQQTNQQRHNKRRDTLLDDRFDNRLLARSATTMTRQRLHMRQ